MKNTITYLLLAMGIFSLFHKSKAVAQPKLESPKHHLAFILLDQTEMPSAESIVSNFKDFAITGEKLSYDKEGSSDDILVVQLEGIGPVFIALKKAAIPHGEAENAFQYSLSSFREGAEIKAHKAHLIVTLMGVQDGNNERDVMSAFTSLLASVNKSSHSVGVYWGNAGATHTPDFFNLLAAEKDQLSRIMLWTGISRAPEENNRISYLTLGMNQLALPDLYLICKVDDASEGMGRLFDLLDYVITRGEAIPDGDTVGEDDEQRIPVNYVKSPADKKTIVCRIEL
ncbi:DUF4261 domain-containing protein [Persicirhabdus sediminis]|uniref:DUF4261 domain-containing protein n=1 Tax=Persicirhabdus sediminis TaxID=454144 RepID=A0A8J7MG71_9BACT|nr:DUF4261 domain-containing protein [Persicirhabdus sediminis]MBK1792247.1 DUF4261 domain-containing protein [Persicirhabdus sediminis]